MKLIGWLILALLPGFGLAQGNTAQIKQAALESARAVLKRPDFGYPRTFMKQSCSPKARRLYPGKPVFVRSLIHPTLQDRQRLQRRIEKAQAKEPDFVIATQDNFYYQDLHRVPIFDRVCGYVFHAELSTDKEGTYRVKEPFQVTRREAQRHLASAVPPTLVGALTYPPERHMWIVGSEALDAFGKPGAGSLTVYRIVDNSRKPISPLETSLKLHISWQPFTLTDGTPSAFWNFYLPVRLEPLPAKP